MKTLKQFIKTSKFNRDNLPSKETLKQEINKHEINENLRINIFTYFLYDNNN